MGLLLNRLVDSFKGVGRMGRSLMAVLAVSTPAELRQQIRYLKAENEALRAQIKGPVRVTPAQRATLVKFARPLGKSIRQVAGIVKPETILRWIRAADRAERDAVKARRPKKKMGRPATPFIVEQIILRIARETGWGYTRIKGELRHLGLEVSRSTVVNLLKRHGLPTGPERGESTWDQFLKAHAETLGERVGRSIVGGHFQSPSDEADVHLSQPSNGVLADTVADAFDQRRHANGASQRSDQPGSTPASPPRGTRTPRWTSS